MKSSFPRYCRLLILSASCQATFAASMFAGSTEVFPLKIGLRFTYQYQKTSYEWSWGSSNTFADTGIVECTFTDSSMLNETIVAWQLIEKWDLLRRVQLQNPPRDTVYIVADSAVKTIYETNTGYHQLDGSAFIWSFPVAGQGQTLPVHRYSDSSFVMIGLGGYGCTVLISSANYDSLWFSSDSGLYSRSTAVCVDLDEWGLSYAWTARLFSRTIVSVEDPDQVPVQSILLPNYPNPFNPVTTIVFDLHKASAITLSIYDMLGRKIAVLADGLHSPGRHLQVFDGSTLGSGMYFARFQTRDVVQVSKMLLLK